MAWLYLPGSAVSNSDLSGPSAKRIAQSVTWRETLMPPAYWRRKWEKEPWIRALSGMTLLPSEADRGVESWILSLRDSRANPGPSPESAPGTAMSGGSGERSSGSLAKWDQVMSCWKTSQASLSEEGSLPFSGRWPRSGTMRNGSVSPRQPWEPRTDGKGSSSSDGEGDWPTPDASVRTGYNRSASPGAAKRPLLAEKVRLWSTLRANEKGQYNSKDSHVALSRQVRKYTNEDSALWPTLNATAAVTYKAQSDGRQGLGLEGRVRLWATPRAIYGEHPGMTDTSHLTGQSISVTKGAKGLWATVKKQSANTPAEHGHGGKDIQTQVALWATLKSRDWKGLSQRGIHQPGDALPNQVSLFGLPGRSNSTDGPNSSPSVRTSPQPWPQLNPRFAEWIMGFPIGWTDLGGSGTPSSRPRRRPRSGSSGGG